MGVSRRRLLQGGLAVVVAGAAPVRLAGGAAAAQNNGNVTASWFSRTSYTPLVGTAFGVTVGQSTAALTLASVSDITSPGKKQTRSPEGQFSLVFTGSAGVEQGTYPIQHAALGSSALFVVPIGAKGATQRYEVIVNRLQ